MTLVSTHQKLSESTMRELKDLLDWSIVTKYQSFGLEFLGEFHSRIDFCNLMKYKREILPPAFYDKNSRAIKCILLAEICEALDRNGHPYNPYNPYIKP